MPGPRTSTHRSHAQRAASGGRPNTLGLGARELAELLDRFEGPEGATPAPKRDFVRWPFRHTSIRVQIFHPGGANAWITVACRNISRAGMAILHSSYMHPGTRCQVILPHPQRGELTVDGVVTRCGHRTGVVHEIGLRFSSPIDVQEILRPDPLSDWFSLERVNPQDLVGSIVCVDDSEIDRQIVRHFLRETRLVCAQAASAAEAMAGIDDTTDLVLIDFHLGDGNGHDLAARLRQAGREMPIIIVTCDTQSAVAAGHGQFSAILAKPLSQEVLLRALAEFLIVRKRADRASAGTASAGAAGSQLAAGIAAALAQHAMRLNECIQKQDAAAARNLCLQIAGTAGAGGFVEINSLATKAAEALQRNHSTTESHTSLRALLAACQGTTKGGRPPVQNRP